MSTHISEFVNSDRFISMKIDYSVDRGHWEYPYRGESLKYWVCSDITLYDVEVLFVEYYNPSGDCITTIDRSNLSPYAKELLDGEMWDYVNEQIDNWGPLADELVEES